MFTQISYYIFVSHDKNKKKTNKQTISHLLTNAIIKDKFHTKGCLSFTA